MGYPPPPDNLKPAESRSVAGISRSLTPDQAIGIINYYELVVNELTDTSGGSYTTYNRSATYKRAIRSGSGTLAVSVTAGRKYNVLLLAGYMPSNSATPVLLASGFAQSGIIEDAKVNHVSVDMHSRIMNGAYDLSFHIETGPTVGIKRDANKMLRTDGSLPKRNSTKLATDPYINLEMEGMHALLLAYDTAGLLTNDTVVSGKLQNVPVNGLFYGTPLLKLGAIVVKDDGPISVLDKVWPGRKPESELVDATQGEIILQYKLDAVNTALELPSNDADGYIDFEAEYYAFGQSGKGFTKWKVRNGLMSGLDVLGKTGGSVLAIFGNGSGYDYGGGGSVILDQLEIGTTYSFDTPPAISLATKGTSSALQALKYAITPSVPAADSYEIYVADTAPAGLTSAEQVANLIKNGARHIVSPLEIAGILPGFNFTYSYGQGYYATVRAVKANYTLDDPAAIPAAIVGGTSFAVPSAPLSNATATATTLTYLITDSTPSADSFVIYYSPSNAILAGGDNDIKAAYLLANGASVTSTSTSVTISGLSPGTTYYAMIRYVKDGYVSADPITVVNDDTLPVYNFTTAPSLVLVADAANRLQWTITASVPAADSYTIHYCESTSVAGDDAAKLAYLIDPANDGTTVFEAYANNGIPPDLTGHILSLSSATTYHAVVEPVKQNYIPLYSAVVDGTTQ